MNANLRNLYLTALATVAVVALVGAALMAVCAYREGTYAAAPIHDDCEVHGGLVE